MPINTAITGSISRWTGTNSKFRKAFAESVNQLDFADLWRAPGTLVKGPPRIDAQGPWGAGPGKNIQGQHEGNTCAALRIADSLSTAATRADQLNVLAAARAALTASCADGSWRDVTGTAP